MALLDKLIGQPGDVGVKLPAHQFYAALIEWASGETDEATITSFFNLDASDVTDLNWLKGKFDASANKREFAERLHGIIMLAEIGFPGYQTQTDLTAIINRIG